MPLSKFAYTRSYFGPPTPCKYDPDQTLMPANVLLVIDLEEYEYKLSIAELKAKYPYKEIE